MEDSSDKSKLFVGGVSRETTEEILKQHFTKYGSVLASVIAKDRTTGISRGFAFVTFSDPSGVESAIQDSHEIGGRTVEVKKAIPRSEQHQIKQQQRALARNIRTKKIFVGGLSANLTEEEFKTYFEKFGKITDVVVMHDSMTHRPRGFGFITFASEDSVEQVVQNSFHRMNDKLVEVKRAIPKEVNHGGNNGHDLRAENGRRGNQNNYQQRSFLPLSPGYGYFSHYGSIPGYDSGASYPYVSGLFCGSYPVGGYMGFGYRVVPMQSSWLGGGFST